MVEEKLRSRIFIINGVSKSYRMTGWRMGYLIGDPIGNKGRNGFPEPGYQQCQLYIPVGKRRGAHRRSGVGQGNGANLRKTMQSRAGAHFRPSRRNVP